MELSLTFRGETYEDREEFDVIMRARDLACSVADARQYIRDRIKHGEHVSEIEEQTLENLKEILWVDGINL